jgi:hypothetical protein
VHLDQAAHHGQADPQPALPAPDRAVGLGEHVEHARQRFGRDADPGVAHRDQRHPVLAPDLDPDAAARIGVLGGVVEQVGEHLGQAHAVGLQDQRFFGQGHRQLVAGAFDRQLAGLDRAVDDLGDRRALQPQVDLAARDARHFHQVVDQPDDLAHLAPDHLDHAVGLAPAVGPAHQLHRVGDRRQRIAQLVGQGRQELVLAAVGFLQRFLGLHGAGNVERNADVPAVQAVARIPGRGVGFEPAPAAVARRHPDPLVVGGALADAVGHLSR